MDFATLIAGAIDNPGQLANARDYGHVVAGVTGLAGPVAHGRPDCSRTIVSTVGSFVRQSLHEIRRTRGVHAAIEVVDAYEGLSPNAAAVDVLFPGRARAQVERSVAQETGLDLASVERLLPAVVPMVLKILHGGAPAVGGAHARMSENPILMAFLDAERDSDVDLGDALHALRRYLGHRNPI